MHYPRGQESHVGEADQYDGRFRIFHEITPGSYHCIAMHVMQQSLAVRPWNRISGDGLNESEYLYKKIIK